MTGSTFAQRALARALARDAKRAKKAPLVTSMTLQLDGPPTPCTCTKGIEDDRAWFENHVGRTHRIRRPIGAERRLFSDVPPSWHPMIVVRQIKPGARLRLKTILGAEVLNAEASVARLFADLLGDDPDARQWVEAIEAGVREGRL